MKRFPLPKISIVYVLLLAVLCSATALDTVYAQGIPGEDIPADTGGDGGSSSSGCSITGLLSSIPGLGSMFSTGGSGSTDTGGGGTTGTGNQEVPVKDKTVRTNTGELKDKSCSDYIMTITLKAVISSMATLVNSWIVTGNFGLPVFTASFNVAARESAENAAKIFLSSLTGINFCAGFSVPGPGAFSFNLNLALSCTLPSNYGSPASAWLRRNDISDLDRYIATLPENQYAENLANAASGRANNFIQAALNEKINDITTGQGFTSIRDEVTGLIKTPGKTVGDLVASSVITSPQRQVDVANTVQQAITSIITTAITALINKGLAAL